MAEARLDGQVALVKQLKGYRMDVYPTRRSCGFPDFVYERTKINAREAKLAANGPLAVRKIKEGVVRTSGLPLGLALEIENEVSAAVLTSKDAREGPRAFKEKRKPRFTGE